MLLFSNTVCSECAYSQREERTVLSRVEQKQKTDGKVEEKAQSVE